MPIHRTSARTLTLARQLTTPTHRHSIMTMRPALLGMMRARTSLSVYHETLTLTLLFLRHTTTTIQVSGICTDSVLFSYSLCHCLLPSNDLQWLLCVCCLSLSLFGAIYNWFISNTSSSSSLVQGSVHIVHVQTSTHSRKRWANQWW